MMYSWVNIICSDPTAVEGMDNFFFLEAHFHFACHVHGFHRQEFADKPKDRGFSPQEEYRCHSRQNG